VWAAHLSQPQAIEHLANLPDPSTLWQGLALSTDTGQAEQTVKLNQPTVSNKGSEQYEVLYPYWC